MKGKPFNYPGRVSRKTKVHSFCSQMRRKLVRSGTLNLATGKTDLPNEEWRDEPCGTPLFTDGERQSGICKSCAGGWTHPENSLLP
jgi:hypothetical protein